jgi:hypothetical protein
LSREQVERLAQWDSGAYSCACPDTCPTLPCTNDRDDLYVTVAAMLAEARADVVRDVEARLTEVIQERDLYASGRSEEIAAGIAPTVAVMLAEAEQRGREDNADHGMCYVHGSRALEARLAEARAEVVRDVLFVLNHEEYVAIEEAEWVVPADDLIAALAPHMPSAVRGSPLSDERTESEEPDLRTATGRTEAHRAVCGEALGDMRCQLRRGHAGDHEDYSGVVQERRA